MAKALPRGIRNNNPGNLRDFGIKWQGLTGKDAHGMCVFDRPENGLRAMMKDIYGDWSRKGLRTVEQLMLEYAPPKDNNPTSAYAAFVARRMGVKVDAKINLAEPDMLVSMGKALVAFENGKAPADRDPDWYPTAVYVAAAYEALGRPLPLSPLTS